MKFRKLFSAAVAGMLTITSFAVPMTNYIDTAIVSAEDDNVLVKYANLPYTFTAKESTGKHKANIEIPKKYAKSKTITLKFDTTSNNPTYNGSVSMGVFGFGISKDPWWKDVKIDLDEQASNGKLTVDVDIPSSVQGSITKMGFGIWWPQAGEKFTLTDVIGDVETEVSEDPDDPTPADAVLYETKNDKSGENSFTDNKDGTATISSTLSAQYTNKSGETVFTKNPITVQKGKDTKFDLKTLGIDDAKNAQFQSFEFTVACGKDYSMDELQYAGGISIKTDDGSEETWYADDTEYKAENCGNYIKVVWDVPKSVQPLVDPEGQVSFGYVIGKDKSKSSSNDDGIELEYTEIPSVDVMSCTATYTKKAENVNYSETKKESKNLKIATGKSGQLDLTTLDLSRKDQLLAVKFSFEATKKMQKFVGGFGASLDEDKAGDSWYQSSDICLTNCGPEFDVMWVIPEELREAIWGGKSANMKVGYWYGDTTEEELPYVYLTGVEYYIYNFPEADLILTNSIDKEINKTVTILAGKEYPVKTSLEGCTFSSSEPIVASIDENGLVKTLTEGETVISVTSPMGQVEQFTLTVKPASAVITTASTSTSETVTTSTTVTTTGEDPISSSTESSTSKSDTTASSDVPVSGTTATSATVSETTVSNTTEKVPSSNTTAGTTTYKEASGTTASVTTNKITSNTTESSKTTQSSGTTASETTKATTKATEPPTEEDDPVDIDYSGIKFGDVDLNGTVELADVTKLSKFLLSGVSYPLGADKVTIKKATYAADLNGDGTLNSLDLSKLIEFNIGSIKESGLKPANK